MATRRLDHILDAIRRRKAIGVSDRRRLLKEAWLSVREAAIVAERAESTIRRWIHEAELQNVGWGKNFILRTNDVLEAAKRMPRRRII